MSLSLNYGYVRVYDYVDFWRAKYDIEYAVTDDPVETPPPSFRETSVSYVYLYSFKDWLNNYVNTRTLTLNSLRSEYNDTLNKYNNLLSQCVSLDRSESECRVTLDTYIENLRTRIEKLNYVISRVQEDISKLDSFINTLRQPPPPAPTPTPVTAPSVTPVTPPITILPTPPVAEITETPGLDVVADKTTVLANEMVTFTVTRIEPIQDVEVRAYANNKLVWIGSIPVKTLNMRSLSLFPGRILESWKIEADSTMTFTFTAKETREQVSLQITVIKAPVEIKPPETPAPIPPRPPEIISPPPPEIPKVEVLPAPTPIVEVAPPKVDLVRLGLLGYIIYEILKKR